EAGEFRPLSGCPARPVPRERAARDLVEVEQLGGDATDLEAALLGEEALRRRGIALAIVLLQGDDGPPHRRPDDVPPADGPARRRGGARPPPLRAAPSRAPCPWPWCASSESQVRSIRYATADAIQAGDFPPPAPETPAS